MKKAITAGAAIVALTLAGCGTKVDRAGTKKAIAASVKTSGLTEADQTCVVNSIDKYSDKELLALDKEFSKAGAADATSEIGKKYEADVANCGRGTLKKTVLEGLKSAFPDLTVAQSDCASAFLDKLSADEFSAMLKSDTGSAMGEKLAAECLAP
jgi:hypothetical protein